VLTVAKTLRLMMINLPEQTKKKKIITIKFVLSIITKVISVECWLFYQLVDNLKIWKTMYEYLIDWFKMSYLKK